MSSRRDEKTTEPAHVTPAGPTSAVLPVIPDHALIKQIGRGSYGEVWLARNATGSYRAVKVVYRATFDADKPYEREFTGIKEFEPISRSHPSQVDILHVGRNDAAGYFYYVMELADDAAGESEQVGKWESEQGVSSPAHFPTFSPADSTTPRTATAARRIDPDTYEPTTLRTDENWCCHATPNPNPNSGWRWRKWAGTCRPNRRRGSARPQGGRRPPPRDEPENVVETF